MLKCICILRGGDSKQDVHAGLSSFILFVYAFLDFAFVLSVLLPPDPAHVVSGLLNIQPSDFKRNGEADFPGEVLSDLDDLEACFISSSSR